MYAKSTRPSAKREVQKDRSAKRDVQKFWSAKRDDQIARPRRAQACERSQLRAKRAMRMCPRSGQIFLNMKIENFNFFKVKNRNFYTNITFLFPEICSI